MKIKIIESENCVVKDGGMIEGKYIQPECAQVPTGREWEIDIPIELIELRQVWLGIREIFIN